MAKVYVGDVGTKIRLDCNPDDLDEIDIASASTLKILVLKPSGTEVEWTASRYGSTNQITYTSVDDDFDEAGTYKLQAYVQWSSTSIHLGETAKLRIYNKYK
jgi:hypothetical protein